MNYRHAYHAGNFADVFKHTILVSLIKAMQRKDTPFCYLDTHAGIGLYDLSSEASQKSKEYESGITLLLKEKTYPEQLKTYLDCIKKINPNNTLRYYPGSPLLVHNLLRPDDRMILSELHPDDYKILKKHFDHKKNVYTHLDDGYQSLKAFLPPKERRGLILIDPPYEKSNEWSHIVPTLSNALKRFATGVYAVWYPIKDRPPIERFHQHLKQNIDKPILVAELSIYPENSAQHLNGNGMVIINPPWQLYEQIKDYMPLLWSILSQQHLGQSRVFMLT